MLGVSTGRLDEENKEVEKKTRLDFLAFVRYELRYVSISAAWLSAPRWYRLAGPASSLLKMEVALNESVMLNPFRKS